MVKLNQQALNLKALFWQYLKRAYKGQCLSLVQGKEIGLESFARLIGMLEEELLEMMEGEKLLTTKQAEQFADKCNAMIDDILTGIIHAEKPEDILRTNLKYLVHVVKQDKEKPKFLDFVDISAMTFDRWGKGGNDPGKKKLDLIKQYFQLDEQEGDLKNYPLFLSLEPVGITQRRGEINTLVDAIPQQEFSKLYYGLKKLLTGKKGG